MDSVVFFISENLTQDDLGAWVPDTTRRRVLCRVSSIDDTEFHEAGRSGLNPEVRLTVFHADYHGERQCRFESNDYSIYRTKRIPNSDYMDLYLARKGGSNGQTSND